MINFNYETKFSLENEEVIAGWISNVILAEGFKEGDVNYIFFEILPILKPGVIIHIHDIYWHRNSI